MIPTSCEILQTRPICNILIMEAVSINATMYNKNNYDNTDYYRMVEQDYNHYSLDCDGTYDVQMDYRYS